MTKQQAFEQAAKLTLETKRKHVVRNAGFSDAPDYFACPLYELGAEGYRHDAGYAGLGTLVEESLNTITIMGPVMPDPGECELAVLKERKARTR